MNSSSSLSFSGVLPVRLIGLGSYEPSGVITTDFFSHIAQQMGLKDKTTEYLQKVTGIESRHVQNRTIQLYKHLMPGAVGLHEGPAEPDGMEYMALAAASRAITSANIDPSQVGIIVYVSSSDSQGFPHLGNLMQKNGIGASNARIWMVRGACGAISEALTTACEALTLQRGKVRYALVVSCETLLNGVCVLDWATSSLLGDAAVAAVLEYNDKAKSYFVNGSQYNPALNYGCPSRSDTPRAFEADQKMWKLYQEGGQAEAISAIIKSFPVGYMLMNGKEVLKIGSPFMANCVAYLAQEAGILLADVGYVIPHHGSVRIVDSVGKLLIQDHGWAAGPWTVINRVRTSGNTSNCSTLYAWAQALHDGTIKPEMGYRVIASVVGGGFSGGAYSLEYLPTLKPICN